MTVIIDDDTRARLTAFKLSIELVPEPLWYKSLRSRISQDDWDKIRKEVYKESGYRCRICGHSGYRGYPGGILYCHEIWEYDDVQHVQRLKGLEAICNWCHRIHHLGLAEIQFDRLQMNTIISHFKRVNDCSFDDFLAVKALAFEQWEARNEFTWSQDFGIYSGMVIKALPVESHDSWRL